MHIRLLILAILISLVLPKSMMAQTSAQIELRGYVLDRDRQPVPLTSVRIEGTTLGTSTNLKGYYSLRLRPITDSLTIVYSSIGYHTTRRKLPRLTSSTQITVELGEDSQTLGPVIVQSQGSKTSRGMQRLEPGKLNLGTSPAGAVEALVGTLSGVAQKNELSNQYTVRGGNFDENLIYINGVEIYRPLLARSAEQEGLSAINPDLTSSLLFSAGGFSADYGDKSSSVLDIRYKQPDSLEASLQLGLIENRGYVGSRHGKLSQITGVRYKRGNALLSTLDTKAEYDPHYFDAQTYLTYSHSPALEMSFLGHINGTNYNFIPRTRQTTFGTLQQAKQLNISFDGQEVDRFRTYLGALSLAYRPNSKMRHSLSLVGFLSEESETYDITGEYILSDVLPDGAAPEAGDNPLDNKLKALGIGRDRTHGRNRMQYSLMSMSARSQLALPSDQRLLMGLDLRAEDVQDKIAEWSMRDSVGYTTPKSADLLRAHRNLYGQSKVQSLRLSTFAEARMRWDVKTLGDLSLSAGLRASWWSWNRELILSPRLSLRLRPKQSKELELKFASGIYHQAPFYRELRQERLTEQGEGYITLNKAIKSQSTLLLLAGAEYDFMMMNRKFRLSAEAYYKHLWDQNPYIQDNIKLRYLGENTGRGYILGVDAKLFGEFVEGVDSWLSLSLLRGRQRVASGAQTPLPNAPAYNLALFFQDYFPGFKPIRLSLRAVYSAGLPVIHPRGGYDTVAFTSNPYRRVDIGLTYRITQRGNGSNQRWWSGRYARSIDLGLDVLNLFDMVNTSSYYWVTDAYNHSYAVPNYLTRRTWNFSLRLSL